MKFLRLSSPGLLALPVIAICCVVAGSIPAAAQAACDVPPYRSDAIHPRGMAKLVDAPRVIRRSGQKLRIAWEDADLEEPIIRWFSGCRTGQWWPTNERRPAADGRGRFFKQFADLRAPRGSLELWVEFTRRSDDYEPTKAMTYLGKVRMSRTIPADDLDVYVELGGPTIPANEIHTWGTITHQRNLVITEKLFVRTCDDDRCVSRRLNQRASRSRGRRFQPAAEAIDWAREYPPGSHARRFETSYGFRFIPEWITQFDPTMFSELCAALQKGSQVQIELYAVARRADGRGKARRAHASRRFKPSLCPPTA